VFVSVQIVDSAQDSVIGETVANVRPRTGDQGSQVQILSAVQRSTTKLLLSERSYVCMACGMVMDRDVNAAKNLAALGEAMVAGSGPETVNGRGGRGDLALPVKRQPGTAQADNTGTVQPQGRTAVRELTNAH
jgi:putative transposase